MQYVRRLSDEEKRLPLTDLRVVVNPEKWEPFDVFFEWDGRERNRQPEWLEWVRVLALVLVPILVTLIGAYFSLHAAP